MEQLQIKGRPAKTYNVIPSGLIVITFTIRVLPDEELYTFEEIKSDRFLDVQKSTLLLMTGLAFLLIAVLSLANSIRYGSSPLMVGIGWGFFSLLLVAAYFIWRPRTFFLKTSTGKFIRFRISNNEKEVAAFVKTLVERRNTYLRLKYGLPNSYLSYDSQFSNFNILLKENIITAEEYHQNIEILNQLLKQGEPQKIFDTYSSN